MQTTMLDKCPKLPVLDNIAPGTLIIITKWDGFENGEPELTNIGPWVDHIRMPLPRQKKIAFIYLFFSTFLKLFILKKCIKKIINYLFSLN
jgi:hypothetical protein